MLNQEITDGKPSPRKEYNRRHYIKRKLAEAEKKRAVSVSNVFQLFAKVASVEFGGSGGGYSKLLSRLETVILLCLICAMTSYLVAEAAKFYLDSLESPLTAYFKAGIVEGIAILFSFSKGRSIALRWSQKLVVVLLCSLTLWTMTGKLVKSAVQDVSQSQTAAKVIDELVKEQTQKEALQQQLVNKEWLGAARKYEKGLDEVREKLASARKEIANIQAPHVILNGLAILIAFRLLIVVANLICFHRLAEQLNLETPHKRPFLVS